MKRILLILVILVIVVTSVTALKLFVIGEPAAADTLSVRVEEADGQLTIHMQTTDSAMAISDIEYRYDDTILHMTVRKVLCSPLHRSGEKCLYYEITEETEVWLNENLIWTK